MNWFDVDKNGLAKLLERKGSKAFALFELIQNAWDTNATRVDVKTVQLTPKFAAITVQDDDPDGFKDLTHAFTLFAESDKKKDPEKRGRFNLGEKLVLALCRYAIIESTSGAVEFTDRGRHNHAKKKRVEGSSFYGEMRMTSVEHEEVLSAVRTLLRPSSKPTFINGEELPYRDWLDVAYSIPLPTEIGDTDGFLRKSVRKTPLAVYDVLPGETPHLYEMGIPVVELPGDRWHVNVFQKIPLNVDRDNVTPAYLRAVRVEVLNLMKNQLTAEDAAKPWVNDAAGDERADADAITTVMDLRFGTKRVIYDPTDTEGTKLAVSKGYTVIPGGALSGDVWQNVKKFGAALPAGQVTPSPKPYHPDGDPETVIPREEWTSYMKAFWADVEHLGKVLLGAPVETRFVKEPGVYWRATFGGLRMAVNVSKVGRDWFDPKNEAEHLKLIIHEFGHHYASDHLSEEYHRALCDLGARLAIYMSKEAAEP